MVTANHLIEVSKAVSCFSFIDMKVFFLSKTFYFGCGSVGRAVASDSRGPWFEPSHQQSFILNMHSWILLKY